MLKSILIGLEDSASTQRATALALQLAQAHEATLVGLAIIDEPDIKAGAAMGIGGASYKQERDETLILEAHQQAREFERRFLERCSSTPSVTARVLEITGLPAETILAELQNHDVVLLGRDANFRFATEQTDTRTWDVVLHRASKPVIVVPDVERKATGAVVLAYDGSLAATRALKIFADSGLAEGRSLHVVTVNGSGAIAWELATQAVDSLKELGFDGKVHNIVSILPIADALLEVATQIGAELIVMGSFAHSKLRNFFRGSVTQQLVEKTTIPLFLTH